MSRLTASHESFIALMSEGSELAQHGFRLLVRRGQVEAFFPPLRERGFFDPTNNPPPVEVSPGRFRVPRWAALDFLIESAKKAGERHDTGVAGYLLDIIRKVTAHVSVAGRMASNFHTWSAFAEILGYLPYEALAPGDAALVTVWLDDPLNTGLVVQSLKERTVPALMARGHRCTDEFALSLVEGCCSIRKAHDERGDIRTTTAGEPYWVGELVHGYSYVLGVRLGSAAFAKFKNLVRTVFDSDDTHRNFSGVYRPAIEDSEQNHSFYESENLVILGLRESLLGWCEADVVSSRDAVLSLLREDLEVLRRIGIYVATERWNALSIPIEQLSDPFLFSVGHLHEMFGLLRQRFGGLDVAGQRRVLDSLETLTQDESDEKRRDALNSLRSRYLSAIELEQVKPTLKPRIAGTPRPHAEHPDFLGYTTVRVGPGESPYAVAELVAFAEQGVLLNKLNSFVPQFTVDGPTLEGLLDDLSAAVRDFPQSFRPVLAQFSAVRVEFAHALLRGFQKAWEGLSPNDVGHWRETWDELLMSLDCLADRLIDYVEPEISRGHFLPTRDWLIGAAADLLRAGTKDDTRAIDIELLPKAWSVLGKLLRVAAVDDNPPADPMSHALNSPRGRVLEAIFSHAMREVRVADSCGASRTKVWARLQQRFDDELRGCRNANFDMSAICGAYLSQLTYVSPEWVDDALERIFPSEFPENAICAMDGWAYTRFTREGFLLLVKRGVIDRALGYPLRGRQARESLMERLAFAFLSGDESLASERFERLFADARIDDLRRIALTLSTWKTIPPEAERTRLLGFFDRCVEWALVQTEPPSELLRSLSKFLCLFERLDDRTMNAVERLAPWLDAGTATDSCVLVALEHWIDSEPDRVVTMLKTVFAAHVPAYDYKGRIKSVVKKLGSVRRVESLLVVDQLRDVPGMQDLFRELNSGPLA